MFAINYNLRFLRKWGKGYGGKKHLKSFAFAFNNVYFDYLIKYIQKNQVDHLSFSLKWKKYTFICKSTNKIFKEHLNSGEI